MYLEVKMWFKIGPVNMSAYATMAMIIKGRFSFGKGDVLPNGCLFGSAIFLVT